MFSYSVAIRTLGKAGEKYLTTLKSVASQTVPPTSINVYIPNEYDLPKETIGKEKYYRCKKGMIAQRALQYEEIKDEWILFLDDDMYLPPDFIQRALKFINKNNPDSISVDVFLNHKAPLKDKITSICNSVFPMKSDYWGFKLTRAGRYKYNNNPPRDFMPSQTGSGSCILCKKKVFLSIHFEDEIWMDKFGYALGEDQLMNYKIYLRGGEEYVWYNSGVKHLDAGSENRKLSTDLIKKSEACMFLIWHRSIFNLHSRGLIEKILCTVNFTFAWVGRWLFSFLYIIKGVYIAPVAEIEGLIAGIKFINKSDYRKLPLFDEKY